MLPIQHIARASALLAAAALFVACSEDAHDHGAHGHAHEPKFAGTLFEVGDHFANLEVVHDAETGSLQIYTLDGHAEDLLRAPEEALVVGIQGDEGESFEVTLAADVSDMLKNKVGSSCLFSGSSDGLKGIKHFHGTVRSVTLGGKVFKDLEFGMGHGDHDEEGEEGEHHESDGHDDK